MPEIKKILIIKPSALGDIVLAMPAVCCLNENFPQAEIHWFVRPEFASIVKNHKCVDDIVIFDRKKLGKWWCNFEAFKEFAGLIKKLRKSEYDLVFDFQGRFRSAIFGWFSGCKKRIGIAGTQELTSIFYSQTIKQKAGSVHVVDLFLDMVEAAGAKRGKIEFGLKADTQAIADTEKILAENAIDKNNYAVFVPGATVDEKRWPEEYFAKLAQKINERFKCGIVGAGVKSESKIVENIKQKSGMPVLNLAGKTTILQLAALLAGARIAVSNDTGPAHIAAALGVPMVLIFGRTNPLRVGPYARPWTVAAVDGNNRSSEVESDNAAHDIKNVSVDDVFEIICKQIN
ncbi:MAG: Lipopolysaccharide heptosyltransferase 1 [Planctomycetes bacterium ADurb.Bin401]|nr:MAG: Lipopolysaccharide heptosyltransferase 1 [Planctomycetes bacterium ADurb.Bin401]